MRRGTVVKEGFKVLPCQKFLGQRLVNKGEKMIFKKVILSKRYLCMYGARYEVCLLKSL